MLIKKKFLYIFLNIGFLNIKMTVINYKKKNSYIEKIINKNQQIKSGRKDYEYFENRVIKNILLIKTFVRTKDVNQFISLSKTLYLILFLFN